MGTPWQPRKCRVWSCVGSILNREPTLKILFNKDLHFLWIFNYFVNRWTCDWKNKVLEETVEGLIPLDRRSKTKTIGRSPLATPSLPHWWLRSNQKGREPLTNVCDLLPRLIYRFVSGRPQHQGPLSSQSWPAGGPVCGSVFLLICPCRYVRSLLSTTLGVPRVLSRETGKTGTIMLSLILSVHQGLGSCDWTPTSSVCSFIKVFVKGFTRSSQY